MPYETILKNFYIVFPFILSYGMENLIILDLAITKGEI